ncbi:MAG: cysteine--tRNA ligase [Candidatus ainarchaeum sp.]|nr:cysteine--tRNA ligase [Candidatus ainarchaeum sp.]
MVLKIFNSFGNKLEEFKPINKKEVGLYTCGPTVYNFAHIGNFRAYCWEDILKRYLIFLGYKVKQVMNLTDIDDKTIKGSIEEKIPLNEFTEKYKKAFFEDIKILNILPADIYPEATEHIKEMIELIKELLKKGFAYKSEDNSIYFSIKKFNNYGKLAGINVNKLKEGARIKKDEYEKEGVGDFVLWKAWDEEDGTVYWETSLGKGRPGWHIECSAMSTKYLGKTFDLHTGGIDNKFPHHENEIAQSEAATGKKFVNYWLHCEHLMIEGKKMSKSLGNFYSLRDLLEKNLNPIAIRYTLINSHYRQPLNFTFESVKNSEKTIQGLQRFIERLLEIKEEKENDSVEIFTKEALENFEKAMSNDLNVPEATKHLFEFARKINKLIDENSIGINSKKEVINFLKKIDSVLGIMDFKEKFFELNEEQKKLVKNREEARKNKNWALADEIRDQLKKQGIEIIDKKNGSTTTKKI